MYATWFREFVQFGVHIAHTTCASIIIVFHGTLQETLRRAPHTGPAPTPVYPAHGEKTKNTPAESAERARNGQNNPIENYACWAGSGCGAFSAATARSIRSAASMSVASLLQKANRTKLAPKCLFAAE